MSEEEQLPEFPLYHFDRDTGEYKGQSIARLDPLEEEATPLVPAHATLTPVPDVELAENEAFRFIDGEWGVVADHRGAEYWTSEGEYIQITDMGVTPDEAWLDEKPEAPETWDSIKIKRDALMFQTVSWQLRLDREIRMELDPTITQAALDTYTAALANIPQVYENPQDVVWPDLPAGAE